MNKPAVKLCVDCKWFKRRWFIEDECHHPSTFITNFVDGKIRHSCTASCNDIRYYGGCKDEGRWFEPKGT